MIPITPMLTIFLKAKTEGMYSYEEERSEYIKITHVTVSGTPGIGKSIFYLYFIHRYRKDNPGRTLIVCSFTKDRKFQKGGVIDKSDNQVKEITEEELKNFYMKKEDVLYLFDNPPDVGPKSSQMVCFCSPDVSWLKNIEKSFETNRKLFMPLWNYDEFKDACESLELDIPNLKDRYEKIGGVIRLIFASKNVYKKHLEAIRCTVYFLESCYQLYETLQVHQSIFKN